MKRDPKFDEKSRGYTDVLLPEFCPRAEENEKLFPTGKLSDAYYNSQQVENTCITVLSPTFTGLQQAHLLTQAYIRVYTFTSSQQVTSLRYKAYMSGLHMTITVLYNKAYTIQEHHHHHLFAQSIKRQQYQ